MIWPNKLQNPNQGYVAFAIVELIVLDPLCPRSGNSLLSTLLYHFKHWRLHTLLCKAQVLCIPACDILCSSCLLSVCFFNATPLI